jgi:hypothetical protein
MIPVLLFNQVIEILKFRGGIVALGQGKLRLGFGEQLDQTLARFGRVTIELQELLIMPDIEADDLRIFRHLRSLPVGGPERRWLPT